MLTPSFDVSQSEGWVTVTLRVPYVKISEAEVHIEGCHLKFYCRPYFLHLQLPGELASEDKQNLETTTYDADTGTMVIRVLKRCHGEHFSGLEMLTTLLPRREKDMKKVATKPGIEVLAQASGLEGEEQGEEFDWRAEQKLTSDDDMSPGQLVSGLVPYGFALQHHGVFMKLQEEIPSIVDCPDPDHMTPRERRIGRIAHEEAAFNEDHYLADLMDNDSIQVLLNYTPPWRAQLEKWREKMAECAGRKEEPGPDIIPFTCAERDHLKALKNTDYLLDKATRHSLYLGLVDIIYAFAYNLRSTEGESNVESAWTICKLSSVLSWLEEFRGSVHEVIYCSLRRSLCYPLYRHWGLSMAVLQDTRELFRLGRRKLLQCVLEVREILNRSEPYYILNNLYLTDYATWLQKASTRSIQSLADELDEVDVKLDSLGWGLVELEEAAHLTLQEDLQQRSQGHHPGHQQGDHDLPDSGRPPDQDSTTGNTDIEETKSLHATLGPHPERTEEEDVKFIAEQLQQVSITDSSKPYSEPARKLIEEVSDDSSDETDSTSDTTESDTDSNDSDSSTNESETNSSGSVQDTSCVERKSSSAAEGPPAGGPGG